MKRASRTNGKASACARAAGLVRGRVIVIGGGLAGMTVAKELARKGVPVVLLESKDRLGGKIGADWIDGEIQEHGFHVFPAWYVNTRELLEELGLTGKLIDIRKVHHLRRGAFPKFVAYYEPTSASNMFRNLFFGLLPWHETVTLLYFALDLASQPFRERSFLDRICVNGFMRGRFYRSAGVATFPSPEIDSVDALIRAADVALYRAKDLGKDRVVAADSSRSTNDGTSGPSRKRGGRAVKSEG